MIIKCEFEKLFINLEHKRLEIDDWNKAECFLMKRIVMGERSKIRTSNSSAELTVLNLSESFNEILKMIINSRVGTNPNEIRLIWKLTKMILILIVTGTDL